MLYIYLLLQLTPLVKSNLFHSSKTVSSRVVLHWLVNIDVRDRAPLALMVACIKRVNLIAVGLSFAVIGRLITQFYNYIYLFYY